MPHRKSEDTGLFGAPVSMDADRQRVLAIFSERRDDHFGIPS